ncbi:MAG TPA: ABC transporter ATP-binding protein [Streptosporangiaceae bacterium]
MNDNTAGVRLVEVEKRYQSVVAVRSLSLEVPRGSFFSIIGPSGCGKTTTLRIIGGFEAPDRGRVEVSGQDVTRLRPHRRPVNTVFQSYALFPHLSAFENVAFGLREARRPRAEIQERAQEMLDLVGLTGREGRRPRQLSGGQQQRVALGRALVNRPEVLLLDEPLGALDLQIRKEMQAQLKEIQREVGTTFVYVTHDQEEAFAMSDRVAVMNGGILEQVGEPAEVYRRPASSWVAGFVGGANQFPGLVSEVERPGRYVVELANGIRRTSPGVAGLKPGQQVTTVVRPEDLWLRPVAAGEEEPETAATVLDAAFLGSHRLLRLASQRLGMLSASVRGVGQEAHLGEAVALGWKDEDGWVVPAGTAEARPEGAAAQ